MQKVYLLPCLKEAWTYMNANHIQPSLSDLVLTAKLKKTQHMLNPTYQSLLFAEFWLEMNISQQRKRYITQLMCGTVRKIKYCSTVKLTGCILQLSLDFDVQVSPVSSFCFPPNTAP